MFNPVEVEYETKFGSVCGGYVIDSAISPLTGKCRLLVADSLNDDLEAGRWVDSSNCWEVHHRHGLSSFI